MKETVLTSGEGTNLLHEVGLKLFLLNSPQTKVSQIAGLTQQTRQWGQWIAARPRSAIARADFLPLGLLVIATSKEGDAVGVVAHPPSQNRAFCS